MPPTAVPAALGVVEVLIVGAAGLAFGAVGALVGAAVLLAEPARRPIKAVVARVNWSNPGEVKNEEWLGPYAIGTVAGGPVLALAVAVTALFAGTAIATLAVVALGVALVSAAAVWAVAVLALPRFGIGWGYTPGSEGTNEGYDGTTMAAFGGLVAVYALAVVGCSVAAIRLLG